MVNTKTTKFYTPTKKKFLIILVILMVVAGTFFALEKLNVIDFFKAPETTNSTDKTTSTAKTAQEDFTGADEREPGNSLGENKGTGGIVDNNGAVDSGTDTSNPTVSATGEISLYTPKPNASVKSGDQVSGTSTLSKVSYRVIDDISGVIATGTLQVVNGKFSGKLSFISNAKEGQLDIFGTKSDGVEFSNITAKIGLN